jgi:hypothetical protein
MIPQKNIRNSFLMTDSEWAHEPGVEETQGRKEHEDHVVAEEGLCNNHVVDGNIEAALWGVGHHNVVPHAAQRPRHVDAQDEHQVQWHVWILSRSETLSQQNVYFAYSKTVERSHMFKVDR